MLQISTIYHDKINSFLENFFQYLAPLFHRMDVLIRQIRTKYPDGAKEDREGSSGTAARDQHLGALRAQSFKEGGGQEKKGISSTTRDQRLPPQKTQSFKGEKKRTPSWLRRQFSRQMSPDYDTSVEGDYDIAVAAAAFAVKSLEETRNRDEKKERHGKAISMTNVKNKEGDTSRLQEPRAKSITFSDEASKSKVDAHDRKVQISSETGEKKPEKAGGLVPILKKKLSFADAIASSPPHSELPEENTIGPLLPSIKRAPNSSNKKVDKTPSKKTDTSEPKPEPVFPLPKQPKLQPVGATRQSPNKPGEEGNRADTWEKDELQRIKQKYEKLNTTVFDWENKKKKKAKRKLEKIEAELDKRRARAMQHYRNELGRIDSISGKARSKAVENRTNEELRVKEKASKIRLTGEFPATCLCC